MVFACALREKLVTEALAGDERALRVLLAFSPRDLPAAAWHQHRREQLQAMATRLRRQQPGLSLHAAALLLARAGAHLDRRPDGHLPDAIAGGMLPEERDQLEHEIRDLLQLTPGQRHDGRRWPKLRRLLGILAA